MHLIKKKIFWRNVPLSPNLVNYAGMAENRVCDKGLLVKFSMWGNGRDRTLCFKRGQLKRQGTKSLATQRV